jgi:O-antigen ligase
MRWLCHSSRWVFLATLIVAPWFYGGTTKESLAWINSLLAIAIGLWLIGKIGIRVSGRKTNPEEKRRIAPWLRFLGIVTLSILALGWWSVWNAGWIYDSEFYLFVPLRRFLSFGPGSIDYAVSAAWMLRATLLLGAMWLVVDLAQDRQWLMRLWWTAGIAGGSIALFGLLQKATGAEMIFWQPRPRLGTSPFFSVYYYHANAGAFMNLVFPLTFGLTWRAFQRKQFGARAIWITLSVIMIAATVANTSRMAQLLALGIGVAVAIILVPRMIGMFSNGHTGVVLAGAIAVLIVILAAAPISHLEQPLKRWNEVNQTYKTDERWSALKVGVNALPDAGLLGFGPGTLRVLFPYYTGAAGVHGIWRFLHNDYLQTLLEWGVIGGTLWAAIFFGGPAVAIRARIGHGSDWRPHQRLLLSLVVIALIGLAVHALVDFPFQITSIQLYVATYLGVCYGSAYWKKMKIEG